MVDKKNYKEYVNAFLKSYEPSKFSDPLVMKARIARWKVILMRRYKGDSLQDIARDMGITRERVRQIEGLLHKKMVAFYRHN
jgi:DNA-directed RNA polymerase sigma subunit (sigma70/sigma32)